MNLHCVRVFCGSCLRGWADRGVRALRLSNIFPYFFQYLKYIFYIQISFFCQICIGFILRVHFFHYFLLCLFYVIFFLQNYIIGIFLVRVLRWGGHGAPGSPMSASPTGVFFFLSKPPKMAQKPEVEIGRKNCAVFYLWVYFFVF